VGNADTSNPTPPIKTAGAETKNELLIIPASPGEIVAPAAPVAAPTVIPPGRRAFRSWCCKERRMWTPAAPCKDFMVAAAARGAPISIQVDPRAFHAFDAPNISVHELPAYRAGIAPIIGTDPAARAGALQRVPAFLVSYLDK
jgi:hypothetical protein